MTEPVAPRAGAMRARLPEITVASGAAGAWQGRAQRLLQFAVMAGIHSPHVMRMIVYRMQCVHGHGFEGWFTSPEDFEAQRDAARISCPVCEASEVERLPSAPYVNTHAVPAARPDSPESLKALKAFVLAHTQDVGRRFPEVARRIHYGEEAQRSIRGQATHEEAEELREEGIAALPLPPGLVLGDEVH